MSSERLQQVPSIDFESQPSSNHELPFRRIVVGYECDEEARKAMQIATILASDLGSEIVVAATVPPPAATPLDTINPDLFGEVLRNFQRHIRDEMDARGYCHNGERQVHVSFAKPADHILRTAEEQNADLILVGSHGRHGLRQLILGSVSESLATQSTRPVMIIGPECAVPAKPLRTILFATDLKDTEICSGLVAANLARRAHCKLVVLHVSQEKPTAAGRKREWEEDCLREKMKLSVQEEEQKDADPVEFQIAYGEAAEEILAAAGSAQAGLIILGGGEHFAIADHSPWRTLTPILEFARCPVVVVSNRCL